MEAIVKVGLLISVLFAGYGQVKALTKPTLIKLIDNAYSGIVVAIHRDVQENSTLVEAIKSMFTEGSSYLYNSTRRRAFFKSVTILIPKTWPSKPEYHQARNESYDNADVLVAPRPNPLYQTNPYTKQNQGCGKRGVNINFIDAFFLDPNTTEVYGSIGRVLVHEWGHYRWGLFDEYPDSIGDPDNYQEFYLDYETKQWEGTRCSIGFHGRALKVYEGGLHRPCNGNSIHGYEDGCVFVPTPNNATGSIMYGRQFHKQITEFCDKDESDFANLHNPRAPNKQNRLCRFRSCWEVMRETPDFKDGNNPPTKIDPVDLVPNFILVQQSVMRVVLVLDVSGSMRGARLIKMIGACVDYILSVVLDETYVAIVQFNSVAKILSELVYVDSEADRNQLLDYLPDIAAGGTCIGCGLREGLQVLYTFGNASGGVILLLSDGQDNDFPSEEDINSVVDAGVIVDTIALSQTNEDGMYIIADKTGGRFYHYSEQAGDSSLHDALAATVEHADIAESNKRIQLLSTSLELSIGEELTNYVLLDPTIGNKTIFSFQWTNAPVGEQGIDVVVTSPNGIIFNSSYDGYKLNITYRILTVKIHGTARPGTWNFAVINLATVSEEVFCTVASYATDPDVEPIVVTSELSGTFTDFINDEFTAVYAEVRQGVKPVIYAEVWAVVHKPDGSQSDPFQLLDNGAGGDITRNDGVYSRYFSQFSGVGFHGIDITIENNGTAVIVGPGPFARAIPNLDPDHGLKYIGNYNVPPPWTPPSEPTGEVAPPFTRSRAAGSTNVPDIPPDYIPGEDISPPSEIVDLEVAATSFDERTVTLSWTSPGDDLDHGAAKLYEIRRANTTTDLLDNFLGGVVVDQSSIISGNLSTPHEFGNTEIFIISVPIERNDTAAIVFAFAMTAIDDVGLTSEVSNVVQATLRQYIPPTGPPPTLPWTTSMPSSTTTPRLPITSRLSTNSQIPTSTITTPKEEETGLTLTQIIGSSVTGLLILFTIVLLIVAIVCKKKQTKSQNSLTNRKNENIEGQTNAAMNEYETSIIANTVANTHTYLAEDTPL